MSHPSIPNSAVSSLLTAREIVIPHDPSAGALTAVKNVLLQASLRELKQHDHYERYAELIGREALHDLTLASLSPGWVPVELAHAHYEACDALALSEAEFEAMGLAVGDRVQDAVLVSLAKKVREADYDLWLATGPLHRMWPRVFRGGSVQLSRLGPKDQLIEERGYSLNRYAYYRHGHTAALTATYRALGSNATVTILSYSATRDEMVVRVTWT